MAKNNPSIKRKPGQNRLATCKIRSRALHNRYYGEKLNQWLMTAKLTPGDLKKLRTILQTYLRLTRTGQLTLSPVDRHYKHGKGQHRYGRDIDHIFVENFGVSFLPKWDKYHRKAGRIKHL